jgi:NTE family protein
MKPRIALALSGGGFRASIFHLGTLRCVAELGWLSDVDVISTVSGGSILGAFAAQRWAALLAEGGTVDAFERIIAEPFIAAITTRNFLKEWLLRAWTWPFRKVASKAFTRTQAAAELLDTFFFDGQLCSSLPQKPLLILNATNLQSIRAWRFTRNGMGDSRVGHCSWESNPLLLSVCVGASAAFPPVFPPARIERAGHRFGPPLYNEVPLTPYPLIPLTDGGVYDNSGLEALSKAVKLPGSDDLVDLASLLIVSDGGTSASYHFSPSGIPGIADAALLYRVDGIARQQVSALHTRDVMSSFVHGSRQGIFTGLTSCVDRVPAPDFERYCSLVPEANQIPREILPLLCKVRTSLDRFSRIEVDALRYHAYSLTAAFAWCYRARFPEEYRSDVLASAWRINFDSSKINAWKNALADSDKTLQIR